MKVNLATAALLSLVLSPAAQAAGETHAQPTPLTVPSTVPAPLAGAQLCTEKLSLSGFTAATVATRPPPEFPESDASEDNEGWFRLGFTIDTSGETKDIVVLDQIGSPSMAKAARLAVARWKYKPALQDGLAVEQYANSAEMLFRAQHVGNAPIHDAVVAKYDEGRALAASGKYAEGIAVLEKTFEQSLTLYEQAKVSFALAFAYEKSNDAPRALTHIRHALIEGGSFLEKAVVPAALRMRMRIEVANGNYRYAACAASLPATDKFDPAGADRNETTKIVDEAMKKLATPKPLEIRATLVARPAGGDGGVWEHPLSRSKFKFVGLVGQVRDFRLNCTRQLMNGAVDETSPWTIPPSSGPCILRVYGEAGAGFKLVEE